MPPKTYSVALSRLGLIGVTFKKLNKTQQEFADLQGTNRLAVINFLQGKPVESSKFVDLCAALGFDNWQHIAGLDELPSDYPQHNLRRSGAEKFVGRDDELETLHKMLCASNEITIFQISGMPGVGKTELALQYAYRHVTKNSTYPGGICFINTRGTKEQTGLDIIKNVEDTFNLRVVTVIGRKKLSISERVQWCWKNWISKGQVLIIFDDVTDFIDIEEYLPPVLSQFKVLFTSRVNQLAVNIQALLLSTLKPVKSLELLLYLSRRLIQEEFKNIDLKELEKAKELCLWLGHLPLGLELVGTYMRIHPHISFSRMSEDLNRQKIEQESLQEKRHGMTASLNLIAAFELSWKELDDLSLEIAYCIGFFSLQPFVWSIPQEILCRYSPTGEISDPDKKSLEMARDNYLLNYNLLKRVDNEFYQTHALLREFYRYKLRMFPLLERDLKIRWYRSLSALGQVISGAQSLLVYELHKDLLPHLEEAANSITTELFVSSKDSRNWGVIFVGISNLCSLVGAYEKAVEYLQQYFELVKSIDNGFNIHAARALLYIGLIYKTLGKFAVAIKYFDDAFHVVHRTLLIGIDSSLKKRILILDEKELKSLFTTKLHAQREKLPESFDGLYSLGAMAEISVNRAYASFFLGKISEAEQYFLMNFPLFNRLEELNEGGDPSDSFYNKIAGVDSAVGLARIYIKQNRSKEALNLLLRTRNVLEPFILNEIKLNFYEFGLKLSGFPTRDAWQIIELYTNVLDTLGDFYKYQRSYTKAIKLYKDSEAIRDGKKMELGVASSCFNLASVLIAQDLTEGEFTLETSSQTINLNAEALLIKALKMRTHKLAKEHYLVGLTMLYLGQVYELVGNQEEARLNFSEGIRIMRLTFSDDHFVLWGWLQKIKSLKYWDCL